MTYNVLSWKLDVVQILSLGILQVATQRDVVLFVLPKLKMFVPTVGCLLLWLLLLTPRSFALGIYLSGFLFLVRVDVLGNVSIVRLSLIHI